MITFQDIKTTDAAGNKQLEFKQGNPIKRSQLALMIERIQKEPSISTSTLKISTLLIKLH